MAIYLPRTDTLVLEVVKTGSKWVRQALANAGVPTEQIGDPALRGHGDLAVHGRNFRFICCFVREPASWYRSYWAYRMERRWRPHITLDRLCASDSFKGFVRNACRSLPGQLSRLFEAYVGPRENPVHYTGKQESLAEDLVTALRLAGETFDADRLRATPRVNATRLVPELTADLRDLILLSEYEACDRFGYLEGEPDPFRLHDLASRHAGDFSVLRRIAIWTDSLHWPADDARSAQGQATTAGRRYARTLTNFATYMQHIRGDLDAAETLFERAIAAEPDHPRTAGTFAAFLSNVRGRHDEAERLFSHALEVRPSHATNLGDYAVFVKNVRGDHDKAEALYRRALDADPKHARNLGNFALFMYRVRGDLREAHELYRRALEVEPRDARNLGNYALFLEEGLQDHALAEEYYRQAVAADPSHPQNLANHARFLERVRRDLAGAEALLRQAVERNEHSGECHLRLARFLWRQGGDLGEATKLCEGAASLNPRDPGARALLADLRRAQAGRRPGMEAPPRGASGGRSVAAGSAGPRAAKTTGAEGRSRYRARSNGRGGLE